MLAVLMYGCREAVAERTDVMERVGEGVEAESQPLSGELGKTLLSGRGRAV